MTGHPRVRIHYNRPPSREQLFSQYLILEREDVVVTLARDMDFVPAMRIGGDVALEEGSAVVWFTFPGAWHDIGRFHRADGTFTGFYANVITPVEMDGHVWHTTDLYLDVWKPVEGPTVLLDEDEFEQAKGREWIDADTADRVRREATRLLKEAGAGRWPPRVVEEWTLERCLEALEEG